MRRSRQEHFAVGAFNVDNQETLLAIVRGAQTKEAPVLVEVSHDEVSMIGLANVRSLVDNYRAEYGVEMYVRPTATPPRSRSSRPHRRSSPTRSRRQAP